MPAPRLYLIVNFDSLRVIGFSFDSAQANAGPRAGRKANTNAM